MPAAAVILYKCHLFGVNPPALTSSPAGRHHSSAAWRAHELLQWSGPPNDTGAAPAPPRQVDSDCSLCANIERKYQCAWCAASCLHSDQCQEAPAASCPPPQIQLVSLVWQASH